MDIASTFRDFHVVYDLLFRICINLPDVAGKCGCSSALVSKGCSVFFTNFRDCMRTLLRDDLAVYVLGLYLHPMS